LQQQSKLDDIAKSPYAASPSSLIAAMYPQVPLIIHFLRDLPLEIII